MENRPEYACIWLGIAKAGIVPALINNQLKKQSLAHTFTAADVKAIVYGEELEERE
jgi:solute carrier family 27 fatty acid transporter 1/4